MRIVPDSTVTLYGGVDIDTNEQLVFASKANQTAYFQSKIVRAATPCTVVKKTGRLRLEVAGSVIATCNYLSFVNPSFDNKIVYAAIIDYDYVNNECVEISYVIDFWQTWMFDVTFQDMYIEREHLSQADWTKAETNPYDPSILEFKTAESLPVSPDIEKPYYAYGTATTDDGVYIAKNIAQSLSSVSDENGVLLIFSDVSLANADANSGPGPNSPSGKLATLLNSIVYNGSLTRSGISFFKLSNKMYSYLHDNYSSLITARTEKCSGWYTGEPLGSNTINAPTSYVYIDTCDPTDPRSYIISSILGWFTDNYSLNEILGIYPMPNGMMYMSTTMSPSTSDAYTITLATSRGQSVTNKKLDLYPYSYIRMTSPNGDVCELDMGKFKSVQDNGDNFEIGVILDVVEKPNLIVAPVGYKASGAAPNGSTNMNVKEGLIFSQFPTLPYSIDAFRMQMASVVNNIIGNNTVDYSYDIQQKQLDIIKGYYGTLTGTLGAAGDMINGDIGSGVGKAVDAVFSGTQTELNQKRAQNEWSMSEDAYKLLSGDTKDNAVLNNFKYSKPAYVANEYHQINGDGVTNFNRNSFMDILISKVTINPTILAQMDTYFSNYGYTSGRCGIPRVINYIHGSSTTTDVPHWQTLNGKPTTYIKTTDCRVTHSMRPVAMAIKGLLDSGIRMVKGDLT